MGVWLKAWFFVVFLFSSLSTYAACPQHLVVLVDAYSSGALLAPYFREFGWQVGHIHALQNPTPVYLRTFRPQDFSFDLQAEGREPALIQELGQRFPRAFLAGSEAGVELSDRLNERFGLGGNGTRWSAARRQKNLTHEVIRARGLRSIEQRVGRTFEEAMIHAQELGDWDLGKPLVIKPLRAAGSNGVRFVRNAGELKEAVEALYSGVNILNQENSGFVLQRFIEGPEFAVNTVSAGGVHKITDVWAYERKPVEGYGNLYVADRLLQGDDPRIAALRDYAFEVLNALGIVVGPAHLEIKLSPEGPVLIEMAARLCGAGLPSVAREASDLDPLWATAASICAPERVMALPDQYSLRQNAAVVFVTSQLGGRKFDSRITEDIQKLPGFLRQAYFVRDGDVLAQTIDTGSVVGQVVFVHPDPKVVEAQVQQVLYWMSLGRFERD